MQQVADGRHQVGIGDSDPAAAADGRGRTTLQKG